MAEPSVAATDVRLDLHIRGAVQGLGFRPHVFRLARAMGLMGFVSNTPGGVNVCVEGPRQALETFCECLALHPPPLCSIESIESAWGTAQGLEGFSILRSEEQGDANALILPDLAVCGECLSDVFDPNNRRFRYPFTNCTHCGPRFTIITRLPYDRANTSMAGFRMCDDCRAEYENPRDRRFHAQPTACPACGPHLELWRPDGAVTLRGDEALLETVREIRRGRIAAVKGLGGFHLLVDARNEEAVSRLRGGKRRDEKPFALLYPDLETVCAHCRVSREEERSLLSTESPIVLLRRERANIADNVAPDVPCLGVMLPYTPLHHLLMAELGFPVVATSGNLREEPLCIDEHQALHRLAGMADVFLVHDRPIVRPVDDSIVRVISDGEMLLRRARGYAPLPIRVKETGPSVLAVGGHQKNTVALTKGHNVFLSQHVGDLDTPLAMEAMAQAGATLEALYATRPAKAVRDLHPAYWSTSFAQDTGLPTVTVQHHFAHVLACMAEHDLPGPVLGVAWDGSGYGPDGTVWGGEFLLAYRDRFTRVGHLWPFRLPGGEQAVREPRRCALAIVYEALGADEALAPGLLEQWRLSVREGRILCRMIERGVNAPVTTSAGRLFDAVASLAGVRQTNSYEGQAAMALEALVDGRYVVPPDYEVPIREENGAHVLDWRPMIRALVDDVRAGAAPAAVAVSFHEALACGITAVARAVGLSDVVLTGGCFQNAVLLERTQSLLRRDGCKPYGHRRVPPNDGGLALGQAVYGLSTNEE